MSKILIFTVHRAGSMFIHRLTQEVTEAWNLAHFSINDDRHRQAITGLSWARFIETNGPGAYGPIRAGIAEPTVPEPLEDYFIILHLRDPRDVLTSLYFSHAFSHPRRAGRFEASDRQREQWQREGIDHFVVTQAKEFRRRYMALCQPLLGRRNVIFLKYEQMVTVFDQWLERFLLPFGSGAPAAAVMALHRQLAIAHRDAFAVTREDISRHRRQVAPGDHRRKLRHETVAFLNGVFVDILAQLAYETKGDADAKRTSDTWSG